mmetsp:Transcript_25410/g.41432  ORF Transcript_25410/g.41432 Transcript_25410/m.41432 type:complete len:631 (-) Transcript_25410:108-2000(-)
MTDEDVDNNTFGGSSSSFVKAEETTAQRFSALQTQLLCAAIHFFHRHIRSDADVLQRMEGNEMFRLFFEVPYHNKPELNRIFPESVHDCSALHVCSFILSILHQGIFSVSAFIVSVIYLSRFKESSRITLHACTWRPLFLTSLLLADKMWEDKPVRNSSLAKLFPVLSNVELNRMESEFLDEIKFNVLVKPDLFCSFCEKLLAEQVHQEISRCVVQSEYAVTLQAECVDSIHPAPKVTNGKSQVYPEKLRSNGKKPEKLVRQTSPDQPMHEVPVTWVDPGAPRGRSQSPTAIKPGEVHYFAQPIEHVRPIVQQLPAQHRSVGEKGMLQTEVPDPFRGAPLLAAQPLAMQQPMRRSLPAKSSNTQYLMLARAPSVGSQCGAVKVPPGIPCEVNGIAGGSMMAVPAGLAGLQHSPRSPTSSVGPSTQGSAHRSQTPPAAPSQAIPLRGPPVVPHGICVQSKPRSSSAPRVSVAYPHGANLRASSQPMQPVIRQMPTQPMQPCMHAQFSGGHAPYGRQVVVSDGTGAISPVGPVGVPAQIARAPVTRGTMGNYPVRNTSPRMSASSPGMCHVQVNQMKMPTSRGRSPAPVTQGIRAPRAATPTAMVKQVVPGVHTTGMVPRHSLGQVNRPGFA